MTSIILAAVLAQTTPAPQLPFVYVPDARLKMVYPVQLDPVAFTDAMYKAKVAKNGGVRHMEWGVELNAGHCFLHYGKFTPEAKPKHTVKELAEMMYTTSLDLAKGMVSIDPKGDWMQIHEKKFSNRQVTERKIGGFTAVVDAHEDQLAKTMRRMIAWGDDKEQWVLELSLDGSSAAMKEVLEKIVESVSVAKLTPAQAKELKDQEQVLPGIGVKISTPGVFGMYRRPNAEANRPAKDGLTASMSLTAGYDVTVISDTYGDQVKSDTAKFADRLLALAPVAGVTTVKASKITPHTLGSFSGHLLRMDLVDHGSPAYQISLVLTKPGADLIVHIQISKEMGGREKADAILASLKES